MSIQIKLKRTTTSQNSITSTIDYGEPLFIKNTNDQYLGISDEDSKQGKNIQLLKLQPKAVIDKSVYSGGSNGSDNDRLVNIAGGSRTLINPKTTAANVAVSGIAGYSTAQAVAQGLVNLQSNLTNGSVIVANATLSTNTNNVKTTSTGTGTTQYYLIGSSSTTSNSYKQLYQANPNGSAGYTNGVRFTGNGILLGGAWNDYAEFRKGVSEPGDCLVENGDGSLSKSTKYRQPCAYISSDTYGFIIGKEDKNSSAVAVTGRVLAKIEDKSRAKLKIGDAVMTAPDGRVARMNRLQKILFPDAIIGYVSEMPTAKTWSGVKINNRIWIRIK